MNKILLLPFVLIFSNVSLAQVGINTRTPEAVLDINGSLQIRNRILKVGAAKNAGTAGQFLQSGGPNAEAQWKDASFVPARPGEYYLSSTTLAYDNIGDNSLTNTGASKYNENEAISSNWITIPGLTTSITIPPVSESQPTVVSDNRTSVQLNSVVQLNNTVTSDYWVSFAIGIFVDGRLKAVRTNTIYTRSGLYAFMNMSVSGVFDNLSLGQHTIVVAFRRRASTINSTLYFGSRWPNTSNPLTKSMAKSTMRVDVLVKRPN